MKTLPFVLLTLTVIPNFIFSQNSSLFVAHEWGTFTTLQNSNGKLLSGLQKEEESLPIFVNNICFCWAPSGKGFETRYAQLTNVTVKMETPVIYFYSDVKRNVSVNVEFNQGSISQWYPRRKDGEQNPIPPNIYSLSSLIDFTEPKTGWIEWDATILSPNDTSKISSTAQWETDQWVRPRATASNLVKVGYPGSPQYDQIEKFLFYRGIANFDVPVKVEFNDNGSLVITNNFTNRLKYVLVYEKDSGQSANIWWSGGLNSGNVRVVSRPNAKLAESEVTSEMASFEDALVDAGLYRDEAVAMLNTWKESYFEHDGLKVFWIAPRYFTDEILPITITPQPDQLERVIVGRSEVLTPEFEEQLVQYSNTDFNDKFRSDRFFLAYSQLRNEGIPDKWTAVQYSVIDKVQPVIIYPNPTQGKLSVQCDFIHPQNILIRIFNSAGSETFRSLENVENGELNKTIDISSYSDGIYLLILQSDGFKYSHNIIRQD